MDTYPTPVGPVGGVFIHANYVEALLDQRVYRPLSKTLIVILEVVLVLFLAALLTVKVGVIRTGMVIFTCSALMIAISYFLLQNLGVFCEFFVPLILIASHSLAEKVLQWRRLAIRYQEERRSS